MEQQWRQLDLMVLAGEAIRHPQFDPIVCSEVTSLLKLLLKECCAVAAKVQEANDDEQDHA